MSHSEESHKMLVFLPEQTNCSNVKFAEKAWHQVLLALDPHYPCSSVAHLERMAREFLLNFAAAVKFA